MSLLDNAEKTDSPPPEGSPLKKLLPFTTVAVVIAALYVAWTFYSRHQSDVQAQQQIAAKQQEDRRRVLSQVYGSGEIKFTAFSADSGLLRRGEKTELCYGVENATVVTIEPPVEPLKPTYRHCMEVAPRETTTYTITASDGKGHKESHSLVIRVKE